MEKYNITLGKELVTNWQTTGLVWLKILTLMVLILLPDGTERLCIVVM